MPLLFKKDKMKAMVKKACSNLALQYLTSKKGSKMDNLEYEEIKTSKYLLSEKLTIAEKKVLFKLRTRMIPVSSNFGDKIRRCQICSLDYDNQQHLIECFILKSYNKTLLFNEISFKYNDIFTDNILKLKEAAQTFLLALKTRENILKQIN